MFVILWYSAKIFITNYKKSNNLKVFLNPTQEGFSVGTLNVEFTPVLTLPAGIIYSNCAERCRTIVVMSFITDAQYTILFKV